MRSNGEAAQCSTPQKDKCLISGQGSVCLERSRQPMINAFLPYKIDNASSLVDKSSR